ncbi:major capsid protein [Sphingomonas panaciterrae]|uniref:major capsid protein n=1 Tax=Sphingomonas panaciterrae TaxID=1462999 RepID=UPI002FF274E8
MITFDVFNDPYFSVSSMLEGIDKMPYVPTGLDTLIGFEPEPVNTDTIQIEFRNGQLNLINTTLRGAPIEMGTEPAKAVRQFKLPRLAKGDQIFAHQIANLRPYDGEGEVETVGKVLARKQDQLIVDLEGTEEFHRLGALNGAVYNPNGSLIIDFYQEFGISQPAVIDLDLDASVHVPGKLRRDIDELIVTPIETASMAGNAPNFAIKALCSAAFFNRLVTHPDVEKTYLNYAAAAELRGMKRYEGFEFAGVTWIRYRGNTQIGITANQCKIFPVGVPRMFKHVMGPCNERFETMHQMGRRYYPLLVRDKDRDQWVQPEIYSYPGFLNLRPDLVLRAQI